MTEKLPCVGRPRVMESAKFFEVADLEQLRVQEGKRYYEFLRVPVMSAGLYTLPADGTDPQKPHKEDELYYVVHGHARMQVGDEHREVKTGTVIFVPAHLEHRFYSIKEELSVLVFFAPAES